ncbi:MAG: hypothetical protein U0105_16540 [Candidatus Obscuribacterales bacterium]
MSGTGRLSDAASQDRAVKSAEVAAAFLDENATQVGDASTAAAAKATAGRNGGKLTRRDEITGLLEHQSQAALTDRDRREMGNWLTSHFSRLTEANLAPGDGVSKDDIIESYSSAKWNDNSKFLWSDMRMLKRVASHFDTLALGGTTADSVEKEDIDTLIRRGTVKRSDNDVTTTFPDGSLTRRTNNGDLFKKDADGSMHFQASTVQMELAANGSGYLRLQEPKLFGGGTEAKEIKLTKGASNVWSGVTESGDPLELSIDDHSVRVRSDDMDMLLTTNGGYIRDPGDPNFAMFINTDGSVTMNEDGKVATIARNPDNGILMSKERDGSISVKYPFGAGYYRNADGTAGFEGSRALPNVLIKADGTITVFDQEALKDVPVTQSADGISQGKLQSGAVVSYDKAKKLLSFALPVDPDDPSVNVTLSFDEGGTFSLRPPVGDAIEMKPPIIKY